MLSDCEIVSVTNSNTEDAIKKSAIFSSFGLTRNTKIINTKKMITATALEKFPIRVMALFSSCEDTYGDSIERTIEKTIKI